MKHIQLATTVLVLWLCSTSPAVAQPDLSHNSYGHTNISSRRCVEKRVHVAPGVDLEYVEQGAPGRTPVIFLHGYTDSWHSFETVLMNLPRDMHAFAISQRGHGNSSRPHASYHPRDFAKDVAVFMKKHNLDKAIVVGHSMGGVIAQQFALDYPDLLKALVLVSTDACLANNPGLPDFQASVMSLKDPVSNKFIDEFQRSTCYLPVEENYYKVLVGEGHKVPARVWKAAMIGFMGVNYTPLLKNIVQPTLVVWGDKDTFISLQDQQVFRKGIPGARLLIYPETGHALHWERPQKFAADLDDFLLQIDVDQDPCETHREERSGPKDSQDMKGL